MVKFKVKDLIYAGDKDLIFQIIEILSDSYVTKVIRADDSDTYFEVGKEYTFSIGTMDSYCDKLSDDESMVEML